MPAFTWYSTAHFLFLRVSQTTGIHLELAHGVPDSGVIPWYTISLFLCWLRTAACQYAP